MNFTSAVNSNYVTFSGRASRSEFWLFLLFSFLAAIVIGVIDGILGSYPLLYSLFALANFLPSLALSVRRLHDVNKSGWFYLLFLIPLVGAIILLVWGCTKGTAGDNRFGGDPLAA
jgi:uncharacterized membrane protein YhaH (DUF805 family)